MLKRYHYTDKPEIYALADYNAGRQQVLKWIKGAAYTNSTEFLKNMSYPTTKQYIFIGMELKLAGGTGKWANAL